MLGFVSHALAWNEAGHALVTRLAFQALPSDFPNWVKTSENETRLAYLSAEPDRWRGQGSLALSHVNSPDHYLDVEEVADFGLTLATLPRFRGEFIEKLTAFRLQHPDDKTTAYDSTNDRDHTRSLPGTLPWAIEENRAKIAASWSILKTYEQYADVVTPDEIAAEKAAIIHYMGILSHFAGDSVQPLHTTRYHNGWVGANPVGYTESRKFHGYIDGEVLVIHNLTFATLSRSARRPEAFNPTDPWSQILADLAHTLSKMEPLYKLEKAGVLEKAPGKAFIEDCLLEGGARLSGLWVSSWQAGKIDAYLVRALEERRAKAANPTTTK